MNNYSLKTRLLFAMHSLGYTGLILMLSFILFSASGTSSITLAATTKQLGTWNKVTTPFTYTLESVDMTSSTDGWIAGFEGRSAGNNDIGSVILHWDGSTWSRIASPNTMPLYSIAMTSATDGWAGGGYAGMFGGILHWDGSTWSEASHPSINGVIDAIAMPSASDGWAVGGEYNSTGDPCYEGTILHWNGTSWSTFTSLHDIYFRSVTAISANDVWVAGQYCHRTMTIPTPTEKRGSVLGHWDGTLWTLTIRDTPTYGFSSIDAVTSNDVWAVGPWAIAHWDGTQWSSIQSPLNSDKLTSVAMTSPTDGWATGGDLWGTVGKIYHWDGNTWEIVAAPASPFLNGVKMLSSNEGWAVGTGGVIFHYTNFFNLFLPLVMR